MSNQLLKGALCFSLILGMGSWIANAMGVDVNNLISAQGIRWLLLHGIRSGMLNYWIPFILLMITEGTIPVFKNKYERRRYFILIFVVGVIVALCSLWPDSPIRGISGKLVPSPLSHASYVLSCLLLIGINMTMHSSPMIQTLKNAIQKRATVIVLFPIFAFLCNEIIYIWK